MARHPGRETPLTRRALASVAAASLAPLLWGGGAHATDAPRSVVVVPFDVSALAPSEAWMGDGIAHLVSFGLTQHPAIVQVPRDRVKAAWGAADGSESVASRVARDVRAEFAVYGRISRTDTTLVFQPMLIDVRRGDTRMLSPISAPENELLTRASAVPVSYVGAMGLQLLDSERVRMEKAAHATRSLRALELFTRGHADFDHGANERAVQALMDAIQRDPHFVMAHYTLGLVHLKLGNRWKCAAQLRAATQLDPTMPEPLKVLGELYLAAPRRLFDRFDHAIEAYTKAIELRPWYADAHAGLGDAHVAKNEIDRALAVYRWAARLDPFSPNIQLKLGSIYAAKGLCGDSALAYQRAVELDSRAAEAPAPCSPVGSP